MVLLVVVVLLWAAVLAPTAWRRIRERQGVESIDHFHQSLQLLEKASPKTVSPAYRLHTSEAESDGATVRLVDLARPKLVLLRPTDDAAAADVDDDDGRHYERVGLLDHPEPASAPEVEVDPSVYRHEEARRRCTLLTRLLCAVAVSTLLIGMWPRLHLVWVLTAVAGLAALGLVGLMAYAKELQAQQRRRARLRRTLARARNAAAAAAPSETWEDDDTMPTAAAR